MFSGGNMAKTVIEINKKIKEGKSGCGDRRRNHRYR